MPEALTPARRRPTTPPLPAGQASRECRSAVRPVLRPWLRDLPPYRPGRPAPAPAGSLASNEPPFPASPAAAAALGACGETIHRYPDPLASRLAGRLATLHDVSPDQILVGNGSDELIFLLCLAYAARGSVLVADPPYAMHDLVARQLGATVWRVPLRDDAHDLTAMAAVAADLAFVCNPANPTGTAHAGGAVARFARDAASAVVVVDEAYVDFARDPAGTTAMDLARAGEVVVLRTFSKLHGLAGLRVGYLVGPAAVVNDLRALRPPFSVNAAAQAAAEAALEDVDHQEAVRDYVVDTRERLAAAFAGAGYDCVDSQANFLLVRTPAEEAVVAHFAAAGISVRAGSGLGLPGAIRISIPPPDGLAHLLATVAAL